MSVLDSLSGPREIANLSPESLAALARELRGDIPERFTLSGDPLESALGLVELTVALHAVFDASRDALLFDLHYQSAAHLLLTRGKAEAEVEAGSRCAPGPEDVRPPYDHFHSRHAGSSLSRALGLAAGREDGGKTVVVVGDGAIVSGVALEALNAGGALNEDVLVVLNDNEMSISRVVGAMGEYLSKIRVGKAYNELKKDAHRLLQSLPIIGERLDRAAEQLKDAVAKAFVPGHMFEMLGPRYFGPVDGHNLPHLIRLLRDIRRERGFYLLHVVTRRDGPAAAPAMALPLRDDDAMPEFSRQGEERWSGAMTDAVSALMSEREESVLVIASHPETPGMKGLRQVVSKNHPDRYWDVGVCEQHGLSFAAGLAHAGRLPIVAVPATFLLRAHHQLFQDVALAKKRIILLVTLAGLLDESDGVDCGLSDLAHLRAVPGIEIVAPRDQRELGEMISMAAEARGAVAIRIPHGFLPDEEHLLPTRTELVSGKAEVHRRGSDIAIFTSGPSVYAAMDAAEALAEKGLEATVISARFIRPIDGDVLERALADHVLVFSVEEHDAVGGLGAALLGEASRRRLESSRIVALAVPAGPESPGSRGRRLRAAGLDPGGIADRILHDYRRHVRGKR